MKCCLTPSRRLLSKASSHASLLPKTMHIPSLFGQMRILATTICPNADDYLPNGQRPSKRQISAQQNGSTQHHGDHLIATWGAIQIQPP